MSFSPYKLICFEFVSISVRWEYHPCTTFIDSERRAQRGKHLLPITLLSTAQQGCPGGICPRLHPICLWFSLSLKLTQLSASPHGIKLTDTQGKKKKKHQETIQQQNHVPNSPGDAQGSPELMLPWKQHRYSLRYAEPEAEILEFLSPAPPRGAAGSSLIFAAFVVW